MQMFRVLRPVRAALAASLLSAGCASSPPPEPQQRPPQPAASAEKKDDQGAQASRERFPPRVLLGKAKLVCNISSRENGKQELTLTSGGGIEFDAEVSPLVDGTMSLLGKDEGGEYRFTSHLAKPAEGRLSGVGDVVIEKLATRVTVALESYEQPEGPGTSISFRTEDMERRGVYVEFRGVARPVEGEEGKKYAFRVNLGSSTEGSGKVTPADSNRETEIRAKSVTVEAPTTTSSSVLRAATTVQERR